MDNTKENGNDRSSREDLRLDWGHIGIMEKKMETIGVMGNI